MERKHVMIFLGFFIVLLFLQYSCSTTKEPRDEGTPAEVMETDKAQLLADRHKASGLGCKDCHKEAQPGSGVAAEACIDCHENYKELGDSSIDPHNAHVASSGCEDCHHAHKPSEMMCQGCHFFDIEVP